MTAAAITPGMPVVCGMDANAQFATVDHMEGNDHGTRQDDGPRLSRPSKPADARLRRFAQR